MQAQRTNVQRNLIAALLIAVAMIAGGGGSPAPLAELAVQLAAAALLLAWCFHGRGAAFPVSAQAWALVVLLLVIPLIQLAPLPPALWHRLPGREHELAALTLVGSGESWRPWSMAPARTLASLLALAVPAIVILMVAALDRTGRAFVVAMVAAIAGLALLVGAAQAAGGQSNAFRFYVPDVGYLNGFQANHNSAADVFLIGMVAAVATIRELATRKLRDVRTRALLAAAGGCVGLFSLGVVLTASRAGTALLPVAWLGVLVLLKPWLKVSRRGAMAAGVVVLLGAAAALTTNGVIQRVLARYDFEGEFRPQLWKDALFAVWQYAPVGSGLGSFVPVFIGAERLEVVDATLPNRAHNDYLELATEAGAIGVVIVAVIAALLSRQFLRAVREPSERERMQAVFAGVTLAIIALHSAVDYPLRSLSLASIAAVAAGVLMPSAGRRGREIPGELVMKESR